MQKFSILKRGIGIESEKCEQVRDPKSMETSLRWSLVTVVQRNKQKINSKTFAIPIVTASGL